MEYKKVYIYTLTDPITNIVRYVGKSVNVKQRYASHISRCLEKKTYKDCWIYSLMKKNLKPILNIIEVCDESNWVQREQYHISLYENLTNLTIGGEGLNGWKASNETKQKMSENRKGKKNSFYGKKHSEETRKKLSIINKERNNNGKNNSFYGKKHSLESRKIISMKSRERWEKGNINLPPVMIGKDNPSTKKRLFISPIGEEFIVYGMKNFCKQHNLSYEKIKDFIDKGKIPTPTEKKDIDRQRPKSKNTIGWEVITL